LSPHEHGNGMCLPSLRYVVGDEQQVNVRCGQLITTQYGRLGVVFERHRGGLFELYSI
jgi:hypothetical protein